MTKRRRHKIALAVERISEIMAFFEKHSPHAILSSQKRRHVGHALRELKKAVENSNSPSVWITSDTIGVILKALLRIYESSDENRNEIE